MMASVVAVGDRRKSLTLRGVDPETCMIVFKNHWAQVVKILEKHEPGRGVSGALSFLSGHGGGGIGASRLGPIPADEASAVQNYVEHMLFLLMEEEAGQGGAMGPILELVVMEGVMERLFLWSLRRQFTEDMKLEQLRMYQMLLSQARQPLLHHKPVLRPLMMLLASCAGSGGDGVVEAELVHLLNQLCVALVKDPSVLELFFHTSEDQGAANFLLFSLLIPYTHRRGPVGRQARDALLLIMSLSASEPRVAQHIVHNTYFCPVLATGLSGLYSSLPARLQVYSDDWNSLDQADWQQVPALVHFLHSLDFCSAVTNVSHPSIRSQLLSYIYNGFLVPVMAPALHKLTVEEVMTTTSYLDLFLRSISAPSLLQTFLSFILLHEHDNVHILDTLVSRVNTPFQLGTVSLALFRTLIGLFCEDVLLQLVLRYLIPGRHLSRKQRCSPTETACCSSAAASILALLPSWSPGLGAGSPRRSELVHWPKGTDPLAADSVGYRRDSDLPMDVNYLQYLRDARAAIGAAYRACRRWSAPYDGTDPPLQELRSDTPGDDGEEDEMIRRIALAVTPPPSALSPTPSSTDTVSTGNQTGRVGSALELEWDDIFADEDSSASSSVAANAQLANVPLASAPLANAQLANGGAVMADRCAAAPPLPPRHIQEMRRSATKLVRGSYVEESDFQNDVLVYDLVAQRDTKAAILERIMAANRRATLTASGKTVMETVQSIMSTRRRSDDGGREEKRGEDSAKEPRRRKQDGEEGNKMDVDGEAKPRPPLTNGFHVQNHTIVECDDDEDAPSPPDSRALATSCGGGAAKNDFLSQYLELMQSLGAEPDADDVTNDIMAFRRRVRALKQRLKDDAAVEDFGCFHDDEEEEEDDDVIGEEDAMDEDEGGGGVPFTGPFISVLLSRLENLLENSIAVNLLVTGILAQLAAYPQPLLRNFLFSTHTHTQHNVRTLYQVLQSLHVQVERYVETRPEFPSLLAEAWRFLLLKDQDVRVRGEAPPPSPSDRRLPPCPAVPPHAKSRVFAIILYAEFLKELAAIAQEHSVAPGWPVEE